MFKHTPFAVSKKVKVQLYEKKNYLCKISGDMLLVFKTEIIQSYIHRELSLRAFFGTHRCG